MFEINRNDYKPQHDHCEIVYFVHEIYHQHSKDIALIKTNKNDAAIFVDEAKSIVFLRLLQIREQEHKFLAETYT